MNKKLLMKQSMFKVQYMNESGEDIFSSSKDKMVAALLDEAKSRLNQIPENTFLREPLPSLVRERGFRPASTSILNGYFIPPSSVLESTTDILQMLVKPNNVPILETYIPAGNFSKCWSKMNEHTSLGMLGLTFGMMKAVMKDPV